MHPTVNVYCDESCHLPNDDSAVMVLGAVWGEQDDCRQAAHRIRELKAGHGLSPDFETKWTKVSPAGVEFYRDLLDYFFDNRALHFRCVVIPDKSMLDHDAFDQTHDDWYYKMYFTLLRQILQSEHNYRIYLDIKDSRSQTKVEKLHEIICNSILDFDREIVERVQHVRSHEVELLQLTDLLIGAVAYANRGLQTSQAKLALLERFRERSGKRLTKSTLPSERQTNIFIWAAQN